MVHQFECFQDGEKVTSPNSCNHLSDDQIVELFTEVQLFLEVYEAQYCNNDTEIKKEYNGKTIAMIVLQIKVMFKYQWRSYRKGKGASAFPVF